MKRGFWILLAIAICVLGGALCASAQDAFYIYQPGVLSAQGDLTLESETAYGTRESRLLGEDAFEQALRLRVSGTDWLSLEAWGGMVFQTNEKVKAQNGAQDAAFSGDLYARALNQEDHYLNLGIGLGYLYDYQQTSIPRVRLTINRSWGDFDLTFSGLGEMPIATNEKTAAEGEEAEAEAEKGAYDEIDLVFNTAASYGFTDWFRLGAEAVLEDTEGFWEEEEAEGGAKMVTGPTADFNVAKQFNVRLNTAAVVPITTNSQTRVPGGANQNETGFLGRMVLAYRF
jgi:hypothetical protein